MAEDDGRRVTESMPVCGVCAGTGKIVGGMACGHCDGFGRVGAEIHEPDRSNRPGSSEEFYRDRYTTPPKG